MNKCFKETGYLSEEGKIVVQPLHDGLMAVMTCVDVQNMSVQELRVLQANLAKLIGDVVSDAIHVKTVIVNKEVCTGYMWHDEYGNESFRHDEYVLCPVHDYK